MSDLSTISVMFEELKQILKRVESNSTKPESFVKQDVISTISWTLSLNNYFDVHKVKILLFYQSCFNLFISIENREVHQLCFCRIECIATGISR